MLSDDQVHARLMQWAVWRKSSRQGDGYPRVNVLHHTWMPRRGGGSAPVSGAVAGNSARFDGLHKRTGEAVAALGARLAATVMQYYCVGGPMAEQALRLGCAPSTVHARVREARGLLARRL